jgi:hypothetical protein
METAEIASINPLSPPILGDFLKLGGTPGPPAGSILHLFFSGLLIIKIPLPYWGRGIMFLYSEVLLLFHSIA